MDITELYKFPTPSVSPTPPTPPTPTTPTALEEAREDLPADDNSQIHDHDNSQAYDNPPAQDNRDSESPNVVPRLESPINSVTPSERSRLIREYLFTAFLTLLTPIPYIIIGTSAWRSFPSDPSWVLEGVWVGYGFASAIIGFVIGIGFGCLINSTYVCFGQPNEVTKARINAHTWSIIDDCVRLGAIYIIPGPKNFHHIYSLGIGWALYAAVFGIYGEFFVYLVRFSSSPEMRKGRVMMRELAARGLPQPTWWSQPLMTLVIQARYIAYGIYFTISPFYLLAGVALYLAMSELDYRLILRYSLVVSIVFFVLVFGALFVGALAVDDRLIY